jgi:HEPN domain-containing protein
MNANSSAWLVSASDDLTLIREILHNEILTHLVAFHAQQAIEKTFKAVLEEYDRSVPRIHSLETLLPKVLEYIDLPMECELLEDLDKLYIDARHPGDFGLLPNGKPSLEEAKGFLELAESIYAVVLSALS